MMCCLDTYDCCVEAIGSRSGLAPDLLVADHLVPGMSGAELARQVRPRCPDLPVLIISGYAEADGIAPDLPRRTKPFRNAELAQSLAALIPADQG
jgi:CheY-like chemotaxis protein